MFKRIEDVMSAIVPIPPPLPRCELTIREAVAGDYAFVDRLQDMHSKALGFMPKAQLQGKIKLGHVLVAEEMQNDECRMQNEEKADASLSSFCTLHSDFCIRRPIGYCMSQDRYFKRDDVGII